MKQALTRRAILQFHDAARSIGRLAVGPKWGYATARNLEKAERVVKGIRAAQEFGKDNEEFKDYEKERMALIEKLSVGPDGKPHTIMQQNGPVRAVHPANINDFFAAMEELKTKYPATIQAMDSHVKGWEEMLNETEEIDFHMVRMEDVPEGLTQDQFNALWPQIMEETEELPHGTTPKPNEVD